MGERGDARRIDPAFCVLASLDPGQGRATRMARDVEALLASAQAAVRAAAAELPSAADLRVEAARAETCALVPPQPHPTPTRHRSGPGRGSSVSPAFSPDPASINTCT